MTLGDSLGPDGRRAELYGIGGWLAFLCVTLLIFTPLGLVFEIAQMVIVSGRAALTPEVIFGMVFGVVITAFAVYTGLGLVQMWRNALRTAKWFFFINVGFGALAFAGFMLEAEGTGPSEFIAVVRWFFGSIAWLVYLYRSERVRNTYSQARAEEVSEAFR
jgi:uncharacterized protein DUF2569